MRLDLDNLLALAAARRWPGESPPVSYESLARRASASAWPRHRHWRALLVGALAAGCVLWSGQRVSGLTVGTRARARAGPPPLKAGDMIMVCVPMPDGTFRTVVAAAAQRDSSGYFHVRIEPDGRITVLKPLTDRPRVAGETNP